MSMKYIEEKSRSGIIHKKFTSAFGKKILEKFGWKEGEGLGKNKSGITDVIQVKRREENKGLGKEEKKENWTDKWWENTYDKVLKNIPKSEKRKDDDDISSEDTEPEQKNKIKKQKKDKIEKEITFLNKKRKITFITL